MVRPWGRPTPGHSAAVGSPLAVVAVGPEAAVAAVVEGALSAGAAYAPPSLCCDTSASSLK